MRSGDLERHFEFSLEELNKLGDIPAHGDFTEDFDLVSLKDPLDDVLAGLTPRQRIVMQMRYGLADGQCKTLKETAKTIGRSKSTAWREERDAIRALRYPNRDKGLGGV